MNFPSLGMRQAWKKRTKKNWKRRGKSWNLGFFHPGNNPSLEKEQEKLEKGKKKNKSWNLGFFQPGTHLRSQGFFEGVGSCKKKGKSTLREDSIPKKKNPKKFWKTSSSAQENSRNSKPQEFPENSGFKGSRSSLTPLDFPSLNSRDFPSHPKYPKFPLPEQLKNGNIPKIQISHKSSSTFWDFWWQFQPLEALGKLGKAPGASPGGVMRIIWELIQNSLDFPPKTFLEFKIPAFPCSQTAPGTQIRPFFHGNAF